MGNASTKSNLKGDIAFYDNYIPTLEDGTYTISAETQIEDLDTDVYFENPITQQFEVRGPQFTLPASDISSIYPPVNSNSVYDQYLPNIVLTKRILPWERYFDVNDKTIPWLCLLVFAEGEIPVDPQTNSSLITSTVNDFLASEEDVLKPDIDPASVSSDVLNTNCSSIQITAEVFNAVAPKVEELKYLAHVREVDISNQASSGTEDPGWFSVITGNRLLQSTAENGTRYYVHLVSLEGYCDLMNDPGSWPNKVSNDQEAMDIALISLYNWTFLSQPEELNFKQLVENFWNQAGGNADNLLLRRYVGASGNPDEATQRTLTRLKNGYVPLNYHTATGEDTFSWYRGPLSPVIAQPLPATNEGDLPSASSLMIYDKTTGIFDHSYSAAWTMGRSLGLADGNFSQALMRFRKKAYGIVGKLMDKLSLDQISQTDLSETLKQSYLRDSFQDLLKQNVGKSLTSILSKTLEESTDTLNETNATYETNEVQNTLDFISENVILELIADELADDLTPIAQWLAQTQLLYKVPFNHLVPDQLSLPVESLRFFYVDQNWLDCLTHGALSLGVQSSKDTVLNITMKRFIDEAMVKETKVIRDQLIGTATGDTEADSRKEAMSGILIRSAVVSGWPGLVVKAYKGGALNGTQLKTLRMERLSSNVLLCLFLDIPDTIMLAEPQQGLCFGVEDGNVINLRKLTDQTGEPTGESFPESGGFETFYRFDQPGIGYGVLNFNDANNNSVLKALQEGFDQDTPIGPAQLALQMVKAPEEISFNQAKQD